MAQTPRCLLDEDPYKPPNLVIVPSTLKPLYTIHARLYPVSSEKHLRCWCECGDHFRWKSHLLHILYEGRGGLSRKTSPVFSRSFTGVIISTYFFIHGLSQFYSVTMLSSFILLSSAVLGPPAARRASRPAEF